MLSEDDRAILQLILLFFIFLPPPPSPTPDFLKFNPYLWGLTPSIFLTIEDSKILKVSSSSAHPKIVR